MRTTLRSLTPWVCAFGAAFLIGGYGADYFGIAGAGLVPLLGGCAALIVFYAVTWAMR